MANDLLKVKLKIAGSEYVVLTDDKESYVKDLGDEVSQKMEQMLASSNKFSTTMAAVLTALEFCDECKKALKNTDNLRAQIKDYLEESAASRLEIDNARREIERLNKLLLSKTNGSL